MLRRAKLGTGPDEVARSLDTVRVSTSHNTLPQHAALEVKSATHCLTHLFQEFDPQ